MTKKPHHKTKRRNAMPSMRVIKDALRRRPQAPKPKPPSMSSAAESASIGKLGYTAAGAAGTALVGTLLAHEGWAPKTIAGVLAAVGAGLAWKGDGDTVRSVGAGAMSAAGGQLALMLIGERKPQPPPVPQVARKNADDLPPGALANALERARMRFALDAESHQEAA